MADGLSEIALDESEQMKELRLALEEAIYWLVRLGVKRSVVYRLEDAYQRVWAE